MCLTFLFHSTVDHDLPNVKLKRNTKTDTVKQKEDYESAAAAETSNEEEEDENKMMKAWMDDDQGITKDSNLGIGNSICKHGFKLCGSLLNYIGGAMS